MAALLDLHKKCFCCLFVDVFPSGGNVMGNETAGMALMNPPSALTDSAMLGSFSAMMATVLVPITCVMVIKTALMDLMKIVCFVVCGTFSYVTYFKKCFYPNFLLCDPRCANRNKKKKIYTLTYP